MATMKEALVSKGPSVQVVDSPVPTPGPGEVLIKVVVSGCNPKDWKLPEYYGFAPFNTGDDIAGIVHAVGAGVTEFKPGDRVASLHKVGAAGGSYAEYALGPADTTFHIPDTTSFEEAATLPMAALTAAVLLHRGLEIPEPWSGSSVFAYGNGNSNNDKNTEEKADPVPIVVYGGASAVGAFAIQLAKRRGLYPIIAVAGRGQSFVETLLEPEKGDAVLDYRAGDEAVVSGIRERLAGLKLRYAFDAVRVGASYINLAKVLHHADGDDDNKAQVSRLALALPLPGDMGAAAGAEADLVEPFQMPPGVKPIFLSVNAVYNEESARDADFGYVYSRYLAKGLRDGWLKPHPHEVQQGGLEGLQDALQRLKDGQASAVKYVFRIGETPGVEN